MSLDGATVLITGGTGSFGKSFAKRILATENPKKVIIFSRDELKQWEMQQDVQDEKIRFFIGDVRDTNRLHRAFKGVDVVVHAAALKQVPACEYNPAEAIKTNVLGAMNVIEAAIDCGVGSVLALSTDKAVSPVNLYGATKLCSDKLFVACNSYSGERGSKFAVVRYGNVVGSRGSVVPVFAARRGQEVSITDPRMTRFWITLEQAVQFVLDSLGRMKGGEVFVPKIPSMNIVDLATALGCSYKITGIRPGEKLHEALISEDEARNVRDLGSYFVISSGGIGGNVVDCGFRYTSDTNQEWLTKEDLELLVAAI